MKQIAPFACLAGVTLVLITALLVWDAAAGRYEDAAIRAQICARIPDATVDRYEQCLRQYAGWNEP